MSVFEGMKVPPTLGTTEDGTAQAWHGMAHPHCQAFACKDGKIRLLNPELNAQRMQKGADALLSLSCGLGIQLAQVKLKYT